MKIIDRICESRMAEASANSDEERRQENVLDASVGASKTPSRPPRSGEDVNPTSGFRGGIYNMTGSNLT
jgi:hypothetical protein